MATILLRPGTRVVPLILVLPLLLILFLAVEAKKLHTIHWNTSNPIFRIDNTDHIIDVNAENASPYDYDQATIVCPHQSSEKFIIYLVDREEYEMCRITNPNPRVIAMCDDPSQVKSFTITFRSFTPVPGGMEFKPGRDYYFISTSSQKDLGRRAGGWCSTHNMKLTFKVAPKSKSGSDENEKSLPEDNYALQTAAYDRGRLLGDDDDRDVVVDDLSGRNDVDVGIIKQEASRMQKDAATTPPKLTSSSGGAAISSSTTTLAFFLLFALRLT